MANDASSPLYLYEKLATPCVGEILRTVPTPPHGHTPAQCQAQCDATPLCTAVTVHDANSCVLFESCAGYTAAIAYSAAAWNYPGSTPASYHRAGRASLALAGALDAPLVHNSFTADPSAHIFDDVLYIIMSHDTSVPNGREGGDAFGMRDYRLIRAASPDAPIEDLGQPLTLEQVPWASEMLWAPDLNKGLDGRYHLVFPARDAHGDWKIGVAHSDHPAGPFVANPSPIAGSSSVDPCAFVDEEAGQAYLYFGGLGAGKRARSHSTSVGPAVSACSLCPWLCS